VSDNSLSPVAAAAVTKAAKSVGLLLVARTVSFRLRNAGIAAKAAATLASWSGWIAACREVMLLTSAAAGLLLYLLRCADKSNERALLLLLLVRGKLVAAPLAVCAATGRAGRIPAWYVSLTAGGGTTTTLTPLLLLLVAAAAQAVSLSQAMQQLAPTASICRRVSSGDCSSSQLPRSSSDLKTAAGTMPPIAAAAAAGPGAAQMSGT
jgi:hypothetical protein